MEMTNENGKKLLATIENMLTESTFNLDALEGIRQLKVDVEQLAAENSTLRNAVREAEDKADNFGSELSKMKSDANLLETRWQLLKEREVMVQELETRVAVAEAKQTVQMEMFNTIFKPAEIRRSMWGQMPAAISDNGMFGGAVQVNQDITETQT